MTDAEESAGDLSALVSRLAISNIRCSAFTAGLASEMIPPPTRLRVNVGDEITYALTEDFLGGKYEAHAVMQDSSGSDIATVRATFLLEHALAPGREPTQEIVSLYLNANGLFIVYPYIRHALQDGFDRLGLGTFVLGILTRDQAAPVRLDISLTEAPNSL